VTSTSPDTGIDLCSQPADDAIMTAAEAASLLTPEQNAMLDEFVASAPPLTLEQQALLTALFATTDER
jgi:hypothetical protein